MELSTSFRYVSPAARIHAGADALRQLPQEAKRLGARRAFVICGQSVARTDLIARIKEALGEGCAAVWDGVRRESPLPAVEAGAAAARAAGADLIIAVGGGSAVVTARAIAILLAEAGTAHTLCTQYPPGKPPFSPRLDQAKLPIFNVLTTPTNAVNRGGAAVQDPGQRRRLELFDPKVRPTAIFLDAGALLTSPVALSLTTAATTLRSVIGALQVRDLNPLCHADLRQALDLLRSGMPAILAQPESPEVRVQLAVASVLECRAADGLRGGAPGVANGIAHQLQVLYDHVNQGEAMAALMVSDLHFNREVLAAGQARLAAALGVREPGMSDLAAAEAAARAVGEFLHSLGLARRLRDLDIPQEDLPTIAQHAMRDFYLLSNPRPVQDQGELEELLRENW